MTLTLKVAMACSGCANAVTKVLQGTKGVTGVTVNLAEQEVTVEGDVSPEDAVAAVKASGKAVELVQ